MSTNITESKSLTPQQQFEEGIKDRIRKDIGDLIPDSVLAQLTEKAIQETFFTKRVIKREYGREDIKPSWFEETVKSLLEGTMRRHVDDYMEKNGDTLAKVVATTITENGPQLLGELLVSLINRTQYNAEQSLNFKIQDQINNAFRNRGM